MFYPYLCPYCGAVMDRLAESCGKCEKYLDTQPHFQRLENGSLCVSAFEYGDVYSKAVLDYKYNGIGQLKRQLSLTLARIIKDELIEYDFDIFTSVPTRFDFKGEHFDQVKPLARLAAQQTGNVYRSVLRQNSPKATQHTLTKEQRAENVKGIYELKRGAFVRGMTILLFDDVITTGSTLRECSDVLLANDADEVVCITYAW